ncbi:unnamed protein product, partial [Didymodactylos carnosus]
EALRKTKHQKFTTSSHHTLQMADGIAHLKMMGTVDLEIKIKQMVTTITAIVHEALLSVRNPTNFPCILKKGVIIGISILPTKQQVVVVKGPKPKLSPEEHIENLAKAIVNVDHRAKFKHILLQFKHLFDASTPTVAKTDVVHAINTKPHSPPSSKFYPVTYQRADAMYEILNELLDVGLISKAKSEYAAPALLTPKSDGSWRFVVDYKKLNNITIKDQFPLPNMEQTIQRLGDGYCFFTKLDLKSGFWQIPIRSEDRAKTPFITPFGLYQFNVLPQGLKNSSPTFQRVMTNVLQSCRQFCQVYLDDGLNLKEPRTLKEANRFIGGMASYRKFIPKFAEVAAPIHAVTNLTKTNRYKFKWKEPQSKTFHELKRMLITASLLLQFPVDSHPVIPSTDASDLGIGGVLHQEINGQRHNLYYHSQLITNHG